MEKWLYQALVATLLNVSIPGLPAECRGDNQDANPHRLAALKTAPDKPAPIEPGNNQQPSTERPAKNSFQIVISACATTSGGWQFNEEDCYIQYPDGTIKPIPVKDLSPGDRQQTIAQIDNIRITIAPNVQEQFIAVSATGWGKTVYGTIERQQDGTCECTSSLVPPDLVAEGPAPDKKQGPCKNVSETTDQGKRTVTAKAEDRKEIYSVQFGADGKADSVRDSSGTWTYNRDTDTWKDEKGQTWKGTVGINSSDCSLVWESDNCYVYVRSPNGTTTTINPDRTSERRTPHGNIGWYDDKGNLLRRKAPSGRQYTYSRNPADPKNPVEQVDRKVTQLPHNPYVGVPEWRQKQLNERAQSLIDKHTKDGPIDFCGFADLMDDITNMKDLTENEKVNVWTTIAAKRGNGVPFSTDCANPEVLDTFNPNTDIWHAIIGFTDGYHAPMAHMSNAEVGLRIGVHEGLGQGADQLRVGPGAQVNRGDMKASSYQVTSLKAFLKDGWAGYANNWRHFFTSPDCCPDPKEEKQKRDAEACAKTKAARKQQRK
jgi:YD repeat-containing protein